MSRPRFGSYVDRNEASMATDYKNLILVELYAIRHLTPHQSSGSWKPNKCKRIRDICFIL
jgi:hypothetical protein